MTDAPPGLAITRVFEATREAVWREWTEPERFADWFGGSEAQVPLNSVAMDVREGGRWRATMFAGAREIRWRGEYREVDPPERLVLTFSDRPDDERYELVSVVLTDLGDGRTEMRMEQRGHLTDAGYRASEQGWGKFFDQLELDLSRGTPR